MYYNIKMATQKVNNLEKSNIVRKNRTNSKILFQNLLKKLKNVSNEALKLMQLETTCIKLVITATRSKKIIF